MRLKKLLLVASLCAFGALLLAAHDEDPSLNVLEKLFEFCSRSPDEAESTKLSEVETKRVFDSYSRWVSAILLDQYVSSSEVKILFFKNKISGRDMVWGEWEKNGIRFKCAQTMGYLALNIAPTSKSIPLTDLMVFRAVKTFHSAQGREIVVPVFGLYLSRLISEATMISDKEPNAFKGNGRGIRDFISSDISLKGNPLQEFADSIWEDDFVWYRNLYIFKNKESLGIGFAKVENMSSVPGPLEGNGWF